MGCSPRAMTIQDLTREVELNAAQSRFISNVSHELRTPLFNIKSYVLWTYYLSPRKPLHSHRMLPEVPSCSPLAPP